MRKVSLFLLGYGGVGQAFIFALKDAKPALKAGDIDLKLIGVAKSDKLIFDKSGINLSEDLFANASYTNNPGFVGLLELLKEEDPRSLIVADLTSAETGDFFTKLLLEGVTLVTANKKPLAGSVKEFEKIKEYCHQIPPRLRYEATVGGGLPIVSTILRLLRSGDEVIDIRGILSGTLGFIMDAVSSGQPFSKAVRQARELKFTEPDPRDDLSGADVARKALILARTLGGEVEPEAIYAQSLVSENLNKVTVEDFLEKLRFEDAKYRKTGRLAYVATINSRGATLKVEELAPGDPLVTLNGPENMICIRTKKYFKNPLVIRGPGAGVEVTAQGVMGDVLRVLGAL